MEKKDVKAVKIILNDIKQLSTFSINLIAIKFWSLVNKISKLSALAQEFGSQKGVHDENFLESIKKMYSEMVPLKNH